MTSTPPLDPRQHRTQTDESLEVERTSADRARVDHGAVVAAKEEQVILRARREADIVVARARARADADALDGPALQLVEQRLAEDALVFEERLAADADRYRARAAFTGFGPVDREKTDQLLLSERARADDVLANRDDFMGMVSHDLRNLLNTIVLHASSLADVASDSDEGRHIVHTMGRITSSVARMSRLIGDLVDIASIDAGKLSVLPETSDVAEIVQEAVDVLSHVAANKGVTLRALIPARPLTGTFDEGRLLQVLTNLINNAVKFTPRGGSVDIAASADDAAVTITVRDTGIGIPTAQLEAVFERFVQVKGHDKRGLGLGLYISKCIVEHHGGRIWATSVLGEGSTFHVVMPVRQSA